MGEERDIIYTTDVYSISKPFIHSSIGTPVIFAPADGMTVTSFSKGEVVYFLRTTTITTGIGPDSLFSPLLGIDALTSLINRSLSLFSFPDSCGPVTIVPIQQSTSSVDTAKPCRLNVLTPSG